jgi:hypothetical protein
MLFQVNIDLRTQLKSGKELEDVVPCYSNIILRQRAIQESCTFEKDDKAR